MARRYEYVEAMRLKADLWRVPVGLTVAALLLFLLTLQVDWAVTRGSIQRWGPC